MSGMAPPHVGGWAAVGLCRLHAAAPTSRAKVGVVNEHMFWDTWRGGVCDVTRGCGRARGCMPFDKHLARRFRSLASRVPTRWHSSHCRAHDTGCACFAGDRCVGRLAARISAKSAAMACICRSVHSAPDGQRFVMAHAFSVVGNWVPVACVISVSDHVCVQALHAPCIAKEHLTEQQQQPFVCVQL